MTDHEHQYRDLVDIDVDQTELHSWGREAPIATDHTISEVRSCRCGETASIPVASVRESDERT